MRHSPASIKSAFHSLRGFFNNRTSSSLRRGQLVSVTCLILLLLISGVGVRLTTTSAAGSISLTTIGSAYTQNFDTLANTSTSSTVPNGWAFSEAGTNANTTYTAGTGSSTTGDTYSFGSTASTERAVGGLQSGTLTPTIGASFTNNTGSTINALQIAYTGEQWRIGNSAAAREDRLDFQYSLNATSLTTGTWTDVDSLDFMNPIKTAAAVGALDGNAAANRSAIGATISGLTIANGSTFWIRWNSFDATGADDGLAVDDFSLTPLTVNAPVVPTCPSTLTTVAGTPVTAPVSASDADGTVTSASITSITPSNPGTITLTGFTPAASVGGTAAATLNVGGSTPAGAYNVTITWSNSDSPTPQTATCAVAVTVLSNAPIAPVCPPGVNAISGVAAASPVSAADPDGVVTSASITSITPSDPGTITLTGFTPAAGVGGTATATLSVGASTPPGAYNVTITWSNNDTPTAQTAACIVAVSVVTPIHAIQGSGNTSPLNGAVVTTRGVVTGVKSNGFFIQAPEPEYDADPNTSEGVFVFTSSAPPPAAAVGNLVLVTGTVSEFIPSSDPFSPPTTEISHTPVVSLVSTGNPLPSPTVLSSTDTSPAGPIEQLEKFEGMRVQVNSLLVIAPTHGNVSEANATATSDGVFYGVITGVARPFREPGIQAPDPAPAGSGVTIPPVPRFDGNPERLRVDSNALTGAPVIDVTAGATITNLAGPLDFAFRTYTMLPDPGSAPGVTGNVSATPVPTPAFNEFTVASFNMERFFDTVNDPATSDVVLTATAFANRLKKASLAIRNVLRFPDVIGVEEMENLTTLQAVANQVNTDAVAAAQPNPMYFAYLVEGNDIGGIDVGFLVKTAPVFGSTPRVTVNAVMQEATGTYINPNTGGSDLLNDRPSLRLMAVINNPDGRSFPVTVIVNHLRSLSGVDDPTPSGSGTEGARVRAKRRAQAEFMANLIQARQIADPSERIVSIGDYNAFQFNDGYVDSIGTIKGTPAAVGTVVLPSSDLVNPDLIDLIDQVPADQRYSFSFDGNAQLLDHELITASLFPFFSRIAYARNNADFPETYRNDANRPERISDHDMAVAYFTFGECTINCPSNIVVTSSLGSCPVVVNYVTPTPSDCGTVTCTPAPGTAFPVGTTPVTCTTQVGPSCSFNVTVNDAGPVIITAPSPVCAGSTGNSASAPSAGLGATYAWSITNGAITAGQNTPSITWDAGGASPATLNVTITNASACSASGSTNVTINPVPACTISGPDPVCPASTNTYSGSSSVPGSSFSWSVSGSASLSGPTNASSVMVAAGSSGSYTLTLTVSANGCGSSCAKTVTISNAQAAPSITPASSSVCPNATSTASGPTGSGLTYSWGVTNGSILSGGASQTVTYKAGTSGSVTLSLAVTNAANCSASGTASVPISSGPLAVCKNVTVNLSALGTASITANDVDGGSSASCGVASRGVTPNSFTCANVGLNTITLTITDTAGNTAQCQATVTVVDNLAPVITCPAPRTVVAANPGDTSVVVNYPAPAVIDNCPSPSVVCSPPSGSAFPLGSTTVTCTARDASGNTASCSFNVTSYDICLQDETNPLLNILVNSVSGDYLFTNCERKGVTLSGRGGVSTTLCTREVRDSRGDRFVNVIYNKCVRHGTAVIRIVSPTGTTVYNIVDNKVGHGTCSCSP